MIKKQFLDSIISGDIDSVVNLYSNNKDKLIFNNDEPLLLSLNVDDEFKPEEYNKIKNEKLIKYLFDNFSIKKKTVIEYFDWIVSYKCMFDVFIEELYYENIIKEEHIEYILESKDLDLVLWMINKFNLDININMFYNSCLTSNFEITQYIHNKIISNIINYQIAFIYSFSSSCINLTKWLKTFTNCDINIYQVINNLKDLPRKLEKLKYLDSNFNINWNDTGEILIESFIKYSDIESLKWLYSKDPEIFKNISIEEYIFDAFYQNNNDVIKFLYNINPLNFHNSEKLFSIACENSNIELVKFLNDEKLINFIYNDDILISICYCKNLNLIKYLDEKNNIILQGDYFEYIFKFNNIDVISYFIENKDNCNITYELFNNIIGYNNLTIISKYELNYKIKKYLFTINLNKKQYNKLFNKYCFSLEEDDEIDTLKFLVSNKKPKINLYIINKLIYKTRNYKLIKYLLDVFNINFKKLNPNRYILNNDNMEILFNEIFNYTERNQKEINNLLYLSCKKDSIKIFTFLLEKTKKINYNKLLITSFINNSYNIFKYITTEVITKKNIKKIINNFLFLKGFKKSVDDNDMRQIKHIYKHNKYNLSYKNNIYLKYILENCNDKIDLLWFLSLMDFSNVKINLNHSIINQLNSIDSLDIILDKINFNKENYNKIYNYFQYNFNPENYIILDILYKKHVISIKKQKEIFKNICTKDDLFLNYLIFIYNLGNIDIDQILDLAFIDKINKNSYNDNKLILLFITDKSKNLCVYKDTYNNLKIGSNIDKYLNANDFDKIIEKYINKKRSSKEIICPICYDNFNYYIITECSHTFCKKCFFQWLKKNKYCSYCKDKINLNNTFYFTI